MLLLTVIILSPIIIWIAIVATTLYLSRINKIWLYIENHPNEQREIAIISIVKPKVTIHTNFYSYSYFTIGHRIKRFRLKNGTICKILAYSPTPETFISIPYNNIRDIMQNTDNLNDLKEKSSDLKTHITNNKNPHTSNYK